MAEAATVAPKLAVNALKQIVSDGEELAKGTRLFDDRGLEHLARFENKLYAEAKGSGAAPYKVQIVFGDEVKARCSCMAARSRPFCKHAAALLVAWARTPEGFVVAETAPAPAAGEAKRKAVKAGKTDAKEVMRGGVEQIATLVRELAVSGVASVSRDRAEQIRALGTALRESGLRRLSARTLALADLVAGAAARRSLEAADYAELFSDLVLTARKLEKHLGGEPLDDRYVEELIGKTWTKKERSPVEGLELIEYAYLARTTADDFLIRESRFLDLGSGAHFAEKQILPAFLVKRTEPKRSYAGQVLQGAKGSRYPSFAPHRVDLEEPGMTVPLGPDTQAPLEALLRRALPDVSAALAAFSEHRRDVFAPDALPAVVAVETLVADHTRLQAVDAKDAALFLPEGAVFEEQLAAALRNARLAAILGDIVLDGALPTLIPLAVLVRSGGRLELRPLRAIDAAAVVAEAKRRSRAAASANSGDARSAWADTARATGMSPAAIALGEVRDELAHLLVTGLQSLVARTTDPLVARLNDLGMAKQAELLKGTAAKPEAEGKLDDLVKLHQVLGIALTRLAGAARIQRGELVAVPTFESVFVRKPEAIVSPREVAAAVAKGELNRFQAAVRYGAYYDQLAPEELARSIYPTWADGSAAPFVVRVFASRPAQALEGARRALGLEDRRSDARSRYYAPTARASRMTAIRVLETIGGKDAAELLRTYAKREKDDALKAVATRAAETTASGTRALDGKRMARTQFLINAAGGASARDERAAAITQLASEGAVEAIPFLRSRFVADISEEARTAAAYALARLGDFESLDAFVRMVRARTENYEESKVGAYALGMLGDVRGIDVLLESWADGWQPMIVAEAMRNIGAAALDPLLDMIEQRPELVKRKAALNVVEAMAPEEVAEVFVARLERLGDDARFVERATLLMTVAQVHKAVVEACGSKLLELRPGLADKKATREEKALLRKAK